MKDFVELNILYTVLIAIIVFVATYYFTKKKLLNGYKERNLFLEREIEIKTKEIEYIKHKQMKFWSVITHELKNLFYKFYNSIDLLNVEFDEFNEEEKKMLIQTISKSYNQTLDVINELMEWTKVNLHTQNSTPEYFKLPALIEEVVNVIGEKFARKEIEIIQDVIDDLTVYGDRMLLNFVLKNILSNSLKFSYRKGRVVISGKNVGREIELKIFDNGMGMSKASLEQLFNIEEIFSTEGTEKERGAGLGLIISKDFIELINGSIQIKSEKEKGTTVIIKLPVSDR